jgi:VanZ family protein
MFHLIKHYPISITIIGVIVYLSFFKPPIIELTNKILFWDKIVHLCMYSGMSMALWLEVMRNHKNEKFPLLHVWIGAIICPIAFGGVVELLQEYLTTYRGGDWLDFVANTAGVVWGSLVSYYGIRRWIK